MTTAHVGPDRLAGVPVGEVMVRRPKVLHASATVGDAQDELIDDHVHLVLVVDGERLVGTVTRLDVADVRADAPVRSVARLLGRTVPPTADAGRVREQMTSTGLRRLAVVDNDSLVGLLCLKRTGRGFCSDRDVAARAAAHPSAQVDSVICGVWTRVCPLPGRARHASLSPFGYHER